MVAKKKAAYKIFLKHELFGEQMVLLRMAISENSAKNVWVQEYEDGYWKGFYCVDVQLAA